jgi:hypothetical protein
MKLYNLIYFVGLIDRPMLWYNLKRLKDNLKLFNGRKLITICTIGHDETSENLSNLSQDEREDHIRRKDELVMKVKEYLDNTEIEYAVIDNSPQVDTMAFMNSALSLKSYDDNEVTFYAHTKGVRYPSPNGTIDPRMGLWAGNLYNQALQFEDMEKQLWENGYAMYGAYKDISNVVIEYGPSVEWHFCGAFYWFKHAEFYRRDWFCMNNDRGVTEYNPGRIFQHTEVHAPENKPGNPYMLDMWRELYASRNSSITEGMVELGFEGNEHNGFHFHG